MVRISTAGDLGHNGYGRSTFTRIVKFGRSAVTSWLKCFPSCTIVLSLTSAVAGGWSASGGTAAATRRESLHAPLFSDTCALPPGGLVGRIKSAVTTDTLTRRIIRLPAMPADSVRAVTDTSVCRRAAIALGRSLSPPDTTSPRTVSVVRVGANYYVVNDSTLHGGEWGAAFEFPSSLTGTAILQFGF
jgi:hypothetical protein